MVNMTLAVPERLHRVMRKHSEIKWTEVARKAIERKARLLEGDSDPWRVYALKRWAEEGEDAGELFEF